MENYRSSLGAMAALVNLPVLRRPARALSRRAGLFIADSKELFQRRVEGGELFEVGGVQGFEHGFFDGFLFLVVELALVAGEQRHLVFQIKRRLALQSRHGAEGVALAALLVANDALGGQRGAAHQRLGVDFDFRRRLTALHGEVVGDVVEADLVGGDKRWCEVDHVTYESVKQKNIHVVGDATIGLPVPKSGNVANAMGKICATAVASLLNGKQPPVIAPGNTCYSWVSDTEAIAVVNAYKIENGKVVQIEQKLTPGKSAAVADNSLSWRTSIWNDMLA